MWDIIFKTSAAISGVVALIQLAIWVQALLSGKGFSIKSVGQWGAEWAAMTIIIAPAHVVALFWFDLLRRIGVSLIALKNPFRNPFGADVPPTDIVAQLGDLVKEFWGWSFGAALTLHLLLTALTVLRVILVTGKAGTSLIEMALGPPLLALFAVVIYLVCFSVLYFFGVGFSVTWCLNIAFIAYLSAWQGLLFGGGQLSKP